MGKECSFNGSLIICNSCNNPLRVNHVPTRHRFYIEPCNNCLVRAPDIEKEKQEKIKKEEEALTVKGRWVHGAFISRLYFGNITFATVDKVYDFESRVYRYLPRILNPKEKKIDVKLHWENVLCATIEEAEIYISLNLSGKTLEEIQEHLKEECVGKFIKSLHE